jgi:hypothetical protein
MPIPIPNLDDRRYQDLLDEARARIPVHTPEWTNFQPSDPGITLIELFAFMTETLLYRCNLVPERNRRVFLNLLGIPLRPASSARGLVTFSNERGPLRTITLNADLEVKAGAVSFRTASGLDVLPIEARAYFKRALAGPSETLIGYYNQLYATFRATSPPPSLALYESVPLDEKLPNGVSFRDETIDGAVWVALLARPADTDLAAARKAIAGATISLGIVPASEEPGLRLPPGGRTVATPTTTLRVDAPDLPPGGVLPADDAARVANYRPLETRSDVDVLTEPGVVEIDLTGSADALGLWTNLDPLEAGARNFPPSLGDSMLEARVLTWLRLSAPAGRLLWLGINTVPVVQRAHIAGERLPDGNGEPDQSAVLANRPVLDGSVVLAVTAQGQTSPWQEIDDLSAAGPEVATPDPLLPPGRSPTVNQRVDVFAVDPDSGVIRFGDGVHGRRPPPGAIIRADYDTSAGQNGNVPAGAINTGPALPAGVKVSNPVRTWGGADAESVRDGEAQITRQVQHQDRMVNAADFAAITLRTPGVQVGRVVVLPAYNPDLSPSEPGDAPGAVTLLVIPRSDPDNPDAPSPSREFLDAVCDHVDPRRLVTTEVFLRPPTYKPIWISVGLEARPGAAFATVREAVRRSLLAYLSPLPTAPDAGVDQRATVFDGTITNAPIATGWPLRRSVNAMELAAVASRVPDVLLIRNVLLAESTGASLSEVPLVGLELPRVAALSIVAGDPVDVDTLRGKGPTAALPPSQFVPVPVVPEECR